MSPTAKMPGSLVWNFSVSTGNCLRSSARPQSAIGPRRGDTPRQATSASVGTATVVPSGTVTSSC